MPELRPYQIEDIEFLSKRKSAGCFNEQRTGKTPIALKIMEKKNCQKVVVICTKSSIYQWQEEYETWLGKPCVVITGTPKQRQEQLAKWEHGLIVSYGTLKATKRSDGMINQILAQNPDGVILDEAHRIKDTKSAAAKAAFACKNVPNRVALTGTPAHGKQHEIFSILHWLYPNTFKSYWFFVGHFFKQALIPRPDGQRYRDIRGFKPRKEQELLNLICQFTTQRKRVEVMPWLPKKDYQRIKLPITQLQDKYLTELATYYETEHVVVQGILDRLVRYRQICLHPKLLGLKGDSPKAQWIKDYITDYPDTPIIIFSKFTSFLKILEEELPKEKVGVIIGDTPSKKREEIRQAFQNGELNVLLLNIDAGKEALTLDRAEVTIFTDKYPPAGDIQQAEDRFVATTEDKANKPHKIIELVMKGTYDEDLYDLVQKRAEAIDIINDYKKYMERRKKNV